MNHIDTYSQNESVYVGSNIVLKVARVNEETGEVHFAITAPPKRPILGLERYLKTRLHEVRLQYRKTINDLLKKNELLNLKNEALSARLEALQLSGKAIPVTVKSSNWLKPYTLMAQKQALSIDKSEQENKSFKQNSASLIDIGDAEKESQA